jgi:glutamine cyclotransferase
MRRVVALTVAALTLVAACGPLDTGRDDRPTVNTIVDVTQTADEGGDVGGESGPSTTAVPDTATATAGSDDARPAPDPADEPPPPVPEPTSPEVGDPSRPAWAPTPLDPTDIGAAAWTVEILDRRPHDPEAFTQGLEMSEGFLYESTGELQESSIRLVDAETGEVIRSLALDPDVFAEGLTIVDDRAIQLTFRAGRAYVRDLETFEVASEFAYEGEGWGLCHDGTRFVMSDGSAELEFRDPITFEVIGSVPVVHLGEPVERLNELECVDGYVLANVWTTDAVAVIDPGSGDVVAIIDASPLTLDAIGGNDGRRVLNGIARIDETTFLLTGKDWPTMYRVRLVPV